MLDSFLKKTIDTIDIPGLSSPYTGKVRQTYDAPGNRKIIIATDRLSAFDRQITTVPLKGQVLTQLSRYWFDATKDVCPNHVIAYPDPNVVVCHKLSMLPVEVIVRGYLAGSTETSILKMYKAGHRKMYGAVFPDGLRANQRLEKPIITPTTKASTNAHDAPLSPQEVAERGIVPKDVWDKVCSYALALFARGQDIAEKRGLILADTKYEFGLLPNGTLVLGDEVHTPDSSRYWIKDSYQANFEAGKPPATLDKDVVRHWLTQRCDPYKDPIPPIPDSVRLETTKAYIAVFEKMTGQTFVLPDATEDPKERIKAAIKAYLNTTGAAD
ncbi:MAG: phosphoribosylaminoimidazolesuccinocarboxamide synthase [Alphaproteobacteria bacterium]|nr:phosphoribosylaminoimidazolesuccinocarboxamide synthase [Alphaproteobacteria bacterium]